MHARTRRLLESVLTIAVAWAVAEPDVVLAQRGRGWLGPIADGRSDPDKEPAENVFLLPDRSLLQQLAKARELLEEERYGDAVRYLGAILDSPEDFFFQPDRSVPIHRSLKAEAQRLIGQMPPKGLQLYQLQFGARAQRMLAEAIASGDADALAELSRRFFHTQAGYEATYLLGLHHFDHARPLAAALTLQRLRQTAYRADQFEPALSLAMASCWLQAGMPEKARDVLRTLQEWQQAHRELNVTVGGKQIPLFAQRAEALDWLTGLVGAPRAAAPVEADRWAMFRGSAARNATAVGSAPLLNMRWEVPVSDDPVLEDALRQLHQMYEEQAILTLPGLHPLAVDDVVLMRTARNLLAVDFVTGRRLWEVPVDDALENLLGKTSSEEWLRQVPEGAFPLGERMWNDATYGTLSSDGRCVFSIEDLGLTAGIVTPSTRMVVVRGQRTANSTTGLYNRLAAHDLHTGKLKWHLGGPADQFALRQAETFFLGPPLPLMGQLYVLAESKGQGAIVLLALDAQTGNLLWSQALAVVERDISEDPLRRMSGVSPSYADGILVCPTSSGAVVAVDLATRSLLWGYRYRRNDIVSRYQPPMGRRFGFGGTYTYAIPHSRWADAVAIVADGRVLVTPVESDALHCLNLIDGKLLWSVPRQDDLYVACVHQDRAVVVSAHGIRALSLADGAPAWPNPVALPEGSVPGGRGFLAGSRYFLPLSSAEVMAIDLKAGRIAHVSKARKGNVPGNLICYKGKVISQGFDGLEAFYQSDAVREEVDRRLAAKPDDPVALALRGEILLDEGRQAEAIACFRRAYERDGDARTRCLLRDALLDGLRLNFSEHRDRTAEIERLLDEPAQQAAYLRLVAGGLQQSGEWLAAFEQYLRLIDLDQAQRQMEPITPTLSVRRDRWIQAQVAALCSEVKDPAAAAKIQGAIAGRLQAAIELGKADALRQFLDYFASQPLAAAARRTLIRRLADADRLLEAELLLWTDQQSADPALAGPAIAEMAEMLGKAGRDEDAAVCYRRLGRQLADVVCWEGKTGKQLVESLPQDSRIGQLLGGGQSWPSGEVEIKNPPLKTARQPSYGRSALKLDGSPEPFFSNATIQVDQNRRAILGLDGWGNERWQISLADASPQPNVLPSRSIPQGAVHGHLLLISTGGKLLAVDTLGTAGHRLPRLLWDQDLVTPGLDFGAMQPFGPVPVGALAMGGLQGIPPSRLNLKLAAVGPSTSRYVCFQRFRNLLAVDPLSGEVLWVARNIPPGGDLFGDDQFVFALPPDQAEALVFRALDGQLLGKRPIPRLRGVAEQSDPFTRAATKYLPFNQSCLATLGRQLLMWSQQSDADGGRRELQLFDPWQQRQVWPPRRFAAGAVADVADNEAVGVCEPDGHFVLLTLPEGRTLVDTKLTSDVAFSALAQITLINSHDQYLLVTHNQFRSANLRNIMPLPGVTSLPIARGWVAAFSKQGQSLWPRPVIVENQCLPLDQPDLVPTLTFACQETIRQGSNSARTQVSIVCLDKRTGRTIYDGSVPNTTGSFDIVGDPKQHTVELRMQQHTVALVFTDKPAAPKPAAAGEQQDEQPGKTTAIDALGKALGKVLGLPPPASGKSPEKEEKQEKEEALPAVPLPAVR
jgi:outer membrane protein assembly factor BamB/tetratricopeptide (TPR) repeat protein